MVLEVGDLRRDDTEILKINNHSLRVLIPKGEGAVLSLRHLVQAARCAAEVESVFLLSLAASSLSHWPLALLCGAVAASFFLFRAASVVVLVASIYIGKLHKRNHRKMILYWSWWHVWTFLFCLTAAVLGVCLGYDLWIHNFKPYYELAVLQQYRNLDPAIVPGARVQDAGIVEFVPTASIDRARGGCFKNFGHTYCIAPIVHGGHVLEGLGDAPRFGSYDYFAVGVDCCSCPNQDFRCGDWENPLAQGGIRSMDFRSRPFYRLAVDDWTAAYWKRSEHPVFFEFVEKPISRWKGLWRTAAHVIVLAVCVPFPLALALALLLARLLEALAATDLASPLGTPAPPAGLERAWQYTLPDMLHHHLEEQKQLVRSPRGTPAPWYAAVAAAAGPPHVPTGLQPA